MRYVVLFAIYLGVSLFLHADETSTAAVTVTITKRAPIESLSASGEITGVKEADAGTKMTLAGCSGMELTLQDAQGAKYKIAASATDYQPPPAPVVAALPAPAAAPPSAPAPAAPKPAAPAPPPAAASGSPAPSGNPQQVQVIASDKRPMMAVWPPGGLDGRPLLMAAHGNGGAGPREIAGWLALAKKHNFTIVCPTFLSSVNISFLPDDQEYFRQCLRWIEDNLKYDKANVYITGFSGGGAATWYLATKRPDFFRGLFLQSGNFFGVRDEFKLTRWFDRPIEVIWGSRDLPDIIAEGQDSLNALKDADCKSVVHNVIQGAGHQEHPDLVVAWMEQNAAAAATSSN